VLGYPNISLPRHSLRIVTCLAKPRDRSGRDEPHEGWLDT